MYDTLRFFSLHFNVDENMPPYYFELEKQLLQSDIKVETYLQPFFLPHNNSYSWFRTLFRHGYGDMTRAKLEIILGNQQYLTENLLLYYFPSVSHIEKVLLRKSSAPQVIELIQKQNLPQGTDLFLLYILAHLEKSLHAFAEVVMAVFHQVCLLHEQYLVPDNPFEASLQNVSVAHKLFAIAGVTPEKSLDFSLSLLAPDCILRTSLNPTSLILGENFMERIERDNKYCNATPYSLATAIGNPVKYEIFKIFLEHNPTPISATGIALQYHTSRNALSYNLKEMLNSGLIQLDHIKGQTHFYKLDIGYLEFIGNQILSLCK